MISTMSTLDRQIIRQIVDRINVWTPDDEMLEQLRARLPWWGFVTAEYQRVVEKHALKIHAANRQICIDWRL